MKPNIVKKNPDQYRIKQARPRAVYFDKYWERLEIFIVRIYNRKFILIITTHYDNDCHMWYINIIFINKMIISVT